MTMLALTVTARADDFVGVRVADGATDDAARLIAAAPDLLDALKRVMRHVPADAGGASLGDDMYRARLAIARATGGK
jgi:hypothetical protein